ncbi:MAG: hypothetical protein R2826_05315 [Thermoleophilia bacterium]
MAFSTRLVLGGLALGTALAYYVKKQHAATGDDYVSIIAQLPAAARRAASDIKERAAVAFEDGRTAARARDGELVRQIGASSSPHSTFTSTQHR